MNATPASGGSAPAGHRPVMEPEVLEALALRPAGTYVDCTFGRGGHARAILARLGPRGRVLAMDRDPEAVAAGAELARCDPRLTLLPASFDRLREVAAGQGVLGAADGVLLDLGVSSPQLEDPARGFSFQRDGPLDMRMDPAAGPSAAQWLAAASEARIAEVLRRFGEERFATRIARAIAAARRPRPITRTGELAALVQEAYPPRARRELEARGGRHPATRTFQALRIVVNDELAALCAALPQALEVLAPGGRLVVIAFHSLEDRIVKRFLRERARPPHARARLPIPDAEAPVALRLVGKRVRPSPAEVAANPRARSAVLRAAEKSPAPGEEGLPC